MQQFDYIPGKNTTDIALIIDAMCLLQSGIYDGFVIVSSDSDFTPMAIHLHEVGVFVMGVGEKTTNESFRRSCDIFIVLQKQLDVQPKLQPRYQKKETVGIEKIHGLLQEAYEKHRNAGGYAYVSTAGNVIRDSIANFTAQKYGYSSLHKLIAACPQKFEINWNGRAYIYRCIADKKQNTPFGKRTIAHRNAVLKYLEKHDFAKRKEFEKPLSLQPSRTRAILHSLIEEGAIVAEGNNSNRVYKRKL